MIALTAASVAFALGSDIGTCELPWDVPVQGCVHHYVVNDTDVLFFEGGAAALTNQMRILAARAPVSVVLHSGVAEVRSPWDAEPRDLDADWSAALEVDCNRRGRRCRVVATRIDVWLGELDAENLLFPLTADVSVAGEDLVRLLAD